MRVKNDLLPNGRLVSTVKIKNGFETMVFDDMDNLNDLDFESYKTFKEAQNGHKELIKKWR